MAPRGGQARTGHASGTGGYAKSSQAALQQQQDCATTHHWRAVEEAAVPIVQDTTAGDLTGQSRSKQKVPKGKHKGARGSGAALTENAPRSRKAGGRTGNWRGVASEALGFATPHGAMAPESAFLEPAPELRGPFLFKVAGFKEAASAEEQQADECCGGVYDWIPACCNDANALGMASDYELFGLVGSEPSQDLPPQRRSQAVLIRGLPAHLCTAPLFQVVLEQAGLRGHINDCIVQMGMFGTEVLVWLSSRAVADYVAWHFHGCCWGDKGPQVQACLVEAVPLPEARGDLSWGLADRVLQELLAPVEEWPRDADGCEICAMSWHEPDPVETEVVRPGADDAQQPLTTIWEENNAELLEEKAEVSTDAGATSSQSEASEADADADAGQSVALEAEDSPQV